MNHTAVLVEEMEIAASPVRSAAWPVWWSAVWVGALAALAATLVAGLIGVSLGAYQLAPRRGIASWREFGIGTLAASVFGAFLAFVLGGWAAARIADIRRAETAMLHGAVVWLLTVPLLLGMATLGAAGYFGDWYAGLAGTPAWAAPPPAPVDPAALRNGALGALAALLLGLMGGVVGGWLGSNEPMTWKPRRVEPRS